MKTAPKNLWLWGGLLPVFIIGFDQLTKYLAVKAFKVPMNICALENQPYAHIEVSPIFDFSLVCNRGVSFGLFSGHPEIARVVFTAFAAIMCIVLLVWMSREKSKLMRLSLGLIIGGAIGNAIDRALFGAVTDFLNFQDIGFIWVFNIADSAITCGVIGLILSMLLQGREEKRAKQAAEAKAED